MELLNPDLHWQQKMIQVGIDLAIDIHPSSIWFMVLITECKLDCTHVPVDQDSYARFDKWPNNGDGWNFQVEKLIVQNSGVISHVK